MKKQIIHGLDDALFLQLEDLSQTGEKLIFRIQGMLSSPIFNFSSLVGKWFFTASMFIKGLGRIFMVSILGIFLIIGVHLLIGKTIQPANIFTTLVNNRLFQAIVAILLLTNGRQILFRLRDQEN